MSDSYEGTRIGSESVVTFDQQSQLDSQSKLKPTRLGELDDRMRFNAQHGLHQQP